jgi:peptide/nickel transport system ATP-binding protein
MTLIEIDSLTVTFRSQGREVRAVEDVSLSVTKGESFGLVGESGSGKSTILRAICGMAPVTGGQIRINGQPLPTPRGRGFAARVQMVFQDPYASLHPRHTIDRTLSEPLAIHGIRDTDARWRMSACPPPSAFAIRTSCRAASASASPSPAP